MLADLTGAAELQAKLAAIGVDALERAGRALYQEALVEAKESMKRTPVDTGALRASHDVERPVIAGRDVSVVIRVGGPAGSRNPGGGADRDVGYAVPVHENLEAEHHVGQAKFLESTILESSPYMAARIARRMDWNRERER